MKMRGEWKIFLPILLAAAIGSGSLAHAQGSSQGQSPGDGTGAMQAGGYGHHRGTMGPGMGHERGMMGPGMGSGYGMMGPGRGYGYGMMGPGMGYGYGMMGPGMGYGYGMPGPGMGYGYGMPAPGMGQGYGMMGPGMDYGCAPRHRHGPHRGMMGRGMGMYRDTDLTTDEVKEIMEHRLFHRGNPRLRVGKVEEQGDDTIVAEIETVDGSLVNRFEIDRHTGEMWQSP